MTKDTFSRIDAFALTIIFAFAKKKGKISFNS